MTIAIYNSRSSNLRPISMSFIFICDHMQFIKTGVCEASNSSLPSMCFKLHWYIR